MATGENSPFRSLVLSIPGHQAKSTLCAFVWKQLGGEELFVWYYCKLSWCACGGARLSGNELEFRVTAFCSRWERICLITCGSSILAMTLTAPPHASQVDISISPKAPTFGEYSFQASPQGAYFWCAQLMAACCSTGDRSSPFIWRLALLPRFDGVTRARCLLLADAALRRTRHGSVSDWLSAWVSGLPGVR